MLVERLVTLNQRVGLIFYYKVFVACFVFLFTLNLDDLKDKQATGTVNVYNVTKRKLS